MKEQSFLEIQNITKYFGSLKVLSDVSLDIKKSEILSIVGENGAGKSTLMKILSGALSPSSGDIIFDGNKYDAFTPKLSKKLGIDIIYQENILVPTMNIIENIFVGREISSLYGLINRKKMLQIAKEGLDFLSLKLDLNKTIENLSVAEQQYVKLLKAVIFKPRILIMDEPTSMFNALDAQKVLSMVSNISKNSISILYISHFLKEVIQISDRIAILRDGNLISILDNKNYDTSIESITKEMIGRPMSAFYKKEQSNITDDILEVRDFIPYKGFGKINFTLKKGEILGIAGMVGSGRTSLLQSIVGAIPIYQGEIFINNIATKINNPRNSIKHSIAYITEDRQKLGLMLEHSVTSNMVIVGLRDKIKSFFTNIKNHSKYIEHIVEKLKIKTSSLDKEVKFLSGGNQQKCVLGKWLFEDSQIFIFDEPTRGIDINSKHEFYKLINELVCNGKSVIMASSDMAEIISLSDRIIVMKNKSICTLLQRHEFSEERILKHSLGVI